MNDLSEPGTVAAATGNPTQARMARIGLLGIAAAALIAAAILVFGSAGAPTGTLAADTTGTGDTGATANLLGGDPGAGIPGRGGFRDLFGGIEITAINGNAISLATADGWTRTITVDSGTTYAKAGVAIALADLKVGDQVGFRQTREDDGTWTIDSIAVIPPHVAGQVTAVTGSTITVSGRDGETATITVDGSTTYRVNGDDAALADVKVGMVLVAEGTENGDGSLQAETVRAGDKGELRGPGGPGRGPGFFGRGPGDWGPEGPDATTAPSATGSAS
jgi:hypothetical protein